MWKMFLNSDFVVILPLCLFHGGGKMNIVAQDYFYHNGYDVDFMTMGIEQTEEL